MLIHTCITKCGPKSVRGYLHPKLAQAFDPGFLRIASDDRRIDRADRYPCDPVGMDAGLRKGLVDARLVGP
jgi:hypothetical protein